MSLGLTSFEGSGEVVSGRLKISRKVVGFLQSFLQSGLQQEREGPPELVILVGLMMSGRLDSNQRPPEPHSGALAKLRHAPSFFLLSRAGAECQGRAAVAGGCHFCSISFSFGVIASAQI